MQRTLMLSHQPCKAKDWTELSGQSCPWSSQDANEADHYEIHACKLDMCNRSRQTHTNVRERRTQNMQHTPNVVSAVKEDKAACYPRR